MACNDHVDFFFCCCLLLVLFFYGFSVEEAKTKIYACSTTTYVGFQVLMTEEESKKFEGNCL